ncbi:MAG: FAD-binding protein [Nitrososphaerales archaeon]
MGTAAAGAVALGAVAGATTLLPKVGATGPTSETLKDGTVKRAPKAFTAAIRKSLPTVIPSSWDYTADVVVVGMGFAGEAAAITASDLGAKVILLEKGDQNHAGGNSRVCGQGVWVPGTDVSGNANESTLFDELVYNEAMEDGQGFPTDDTLLQTYVTNCANNKTWLEGLGAKVVLYGSPSNPFPQAFYPQLMGASSEMLPYGGSWTVVGSHPYGNNWFFLQQQIQNRPINVMYSTPACGLVQDPDTGEIIGVRASPIGGSTINIAANKAVILTCGGYEYNDQMHRDYIDIPGVTHVGSPLNTGDGIHMAQSVGADLWHMNVFAAPTGYAMKTPQYDAGVMISTPSKGGWIYLGADSLRYSNELQAPGPNTYSSPGNANEPAGTYLTAGQYLSHGVYTKGPFPVPIHMIFDSVGFGSGALFSAMGGTMGFAGPIEGYNPDPTNKTELGLGWIYTSPTLSGLAAMIGKDTSVMPNEVANWNKMVTAGTDTEYGRTTSLTAISTPPYYAIQLSPMILNTQGGPRRNSKGEVLDTHGEPIPRLYEAGEIGEVISKLYQCMRNVSMCYAMGRIAATNAVALTSLE